MASIASASRSKRKAASNSFVPGFYRALNAPCSANSATTSVQSRCNLRLPANAENGLPTDCFLVERITSTRRNKVIIHYYLQLLGVIIYDKLWHLYCNREWVSIWFCVRGIWKKRLLGSRQKILPLQQSSKRNCSIICVLVLNNHNIIVHLNHQLHLIGKSWMPPVISKLPSIVASSLDLIATIEWSSSLGLTFSSFYSWTKEEPPPPCGRGLFYDLEDFNTTYFSDNWYVAYYDKLGDGCGVHFPIRLESKIKWSSIVYNSDGSKKPRVFTEMIVVTIYS